MQLSVMLFPFHLQLVRGTLSPRELIQTLVQAGAQGFETMHGFEEEHPEIFQELLAEIREAGFPIVCHDIGINMIGDAEGRQQRLGAIKSEINFVLSNLEASVILLYNNKEAEGMSLEEARGIYAENLKNIADFAYARGITAMIEDFDPTPELACSSVHCRQIIEAAAPHAKLCFDTGNFPSAGERSLDVFPQLSHLIRHVHIKEKKFAYTPEGWKPSPCVIGEGDMRIPDIITCLKQIGYDGYLSVEIGGRNLNDAVTALDFLKKNL